MPKLNFHAGVATERLDELGQEFKTKSDACRRLIDGMPWPEERDFTPFVKLTKLGRRIKKSWNDFGVVMRCAKEAVAVSQEFKYAGKFSNGKRFLNMPRGKYSFHLVLDDDQALKLKVLAIRAGLSKTMTLRFLVLGLRLPDRLAMKTAGRMGQVGGLLQYLAWKHKGHADAARWRELIGLSCQIAAIRAVIAESETSGAEALDGYDSLQTH